MKFKTFRNSLTLVTISSLGIINSSSGAKAASISFGQWTFTPVSGTTSSIYATRTGFASPNTLRALAEVITTIDRRSWEAGNATATVALSNSFTVEAGQGENVGDTVQGVLFGNLGGFLRGIRFPGGGVFNTTVEANVYAGFQSFSHTKSHSVPSQENVSIPFRKVGTLTIGQQYPFTMNLTVTASKAGFYNATSNFDTTFTADVQAVPEPLTIMGSALGLALGALFKKEYSRKQKKAKSLEKQKV
jgi:hypothetical protein